MSNLNIDFTNGNRDLLQAALQPALTDLIAFGLTVKQAHWNVKGKNFRPVHLHLDEIYEEVQESIDEVAERLTALSISPNGQASFVTKNTIIPELPEGFHANEVVVSSIATELKKLVDALRARMDTIEDVDTVTADLFHAVVAGLEKQLWMLRSQI